MSEKPARRQPQSNPQHLSNRRPPAHRSVSLKHAPTTGDSTTHSEHKGGILPSTASSLANNKASSGESSSVDHWFNRSNKNVMRGNNVGDDSPPFFLQQSSTDTSGHLGHQSSLPMRTSLPNFDSLGSGSEEYRSVIDDLTIQNKRLRRKLKSLERFREQKLEPEAMFEVKIRCLPRDKKRELEQILADFAKSANRKTTGSGTAIPSRLASKKRSRPSSSLTSTRVADSGYGSLSMSNQGSNMNNSGNSHSGDITHRVSDLDSLRYRDKSIHTFLHDIPEGLLPKPPQVMTEHAKKKAVVQRLEQIFRGRTASDEGHQQPMQQQRVSKSAAEDDRRAIEERGGRTTAEGTREATIMENETEDPLDFGKDDRSPPDFSRIKFSQPSSEEVDERDFALPSAPSHQRPTRPLDLDPHRAQAASDNFDYLRHLGFELSDAHLKRPREADGGWVYLNLIMNMAQLHTVNVTLELVRQAIKEHSKRFELSSDGRKVRWVGSSESSPACATSGGSSAATSSFENTKQPAAGAKRPRPASLNSAYDSQLAASGPKKRPALDKFQYTSIFKHDQQESDEDDSWMSDDGSDSPAPPGLPTDRSFPRTAAPGHGRQDGGPLVFYRDRHFFADLSGDRPKSVSPTYSSSLFPLGFSRSKSEDNDSSSASLAAVEHKPRYFLHGSNGTSHQGEQMLMPPPDDGDLIIEQDDFPVKRASSADDGGSSHFTASGLFGILPKDNLAIHVVRSITTGPSTGTMRRIPNKLDRVLPLRRKKFATAQKILSAHRQELEPSALPMPSFTYSPDCVSVDEDDGDETDVSDAGYSEVPVLATQPVRLGNLAQSREASSEDANVNSEDTGCGDDGGDSDDSDDGSLDFLATARAIDPEAIRASERDYDMAMAERLAEEIPAGSSAATAGGGSGFNSPADLQRKRAHVEADDRRNDRGSASS